MTPDSLAESYVEWLIGSIREEWSAHVSVFQEAVLRRILKDYFAYCERRRKRLTLERVASVSRPVRPPLAGSSDRGFDHIRE